MAVAAFVIAVVANVKGNYPTTRYHYFHCHMQVTLLISRPGKTSFISQIMVLPSKGIGAAQELHKSCVNLEWIFFLSYWHCIFVKGTKLWIWLNSMIYRKAINVRKEYCFHVLYDQFIPYDQFGVWKQVQLVCTELIRIALYTEGIFLRLLCRHRHGWFLRLSVRMYVCTKYRIQNICICLPTRTIRTDPTILKAWALLLQIFSPRS